MKSELLHALRVAAVREGLPSRMQQFGLDLFLVTGKSVVELLSLLETHRKGLNLYEVEYYEIVGELYPDLVGYLLHKEAFPKPEDKVETDLWLTGST